MITYHFYKLIKSIFFFSYISIMQQHYTVGHILACVRLFFAHSSVPSSSLFLLLTTLTKEDEKKNAVHLNHGCDTNAKMNRHRESAANLFDWICMRVSACTFLRIVYNWFWNKSVGVFFFFIRAPILLKHLFKYHDKYVRPPPQKERSDCNSFCSCV